jgi:hypothetical protein
MKAWIWISVFVVLVGSGSGMLHAQSSDEQAQVTLSIFSGMRDPSWTLSANQTAALRQMLAALPAGSAVEEPGNLGYRSFIIQFEDDTFVYVFNNHVEYGDQWLMTSGHSLELWLLGTAGDALDAELTMGVWSDLTTPPPHFAIYLLGDRAPSDIAHADLATLALPPDPVITLDDVIEYRAETYELVLTPEALARLASLNVPVSGIPFVIVIDGEPLFPGAFWISYSSLSYDESVVIDLFPAAAGDPLRLDLGYPASPDVFTGVDYRSDPRFLSVFEAAEKLR